MKDDCRAIDPDTLDRICEVVDESELMRFISPTERARTAELVEENDRVLAESAAGIIVVTGDDDRTASIREGETLERLLRLLTSHGVQYAFLNQPVQVPELRRELWRIIRTPKPPQLLLRIT